MIFFAKYVCSHPSKNKQTNKSKNKQAPPSKKKKKAQHIPLVHFELLCWRWLSSVLDILIWLKSFFCFWSMYSCIGPAISDTADINNQSDPTQGRMITDTFIYKYIVLSSAHAKFYSRKLYPEKTLKDTLFGLKLIKLGTQLVRGQGCRWLPVSFKTKRNMKTSQTFEPSPWGFQKMIEAGTKHTLLLLGIRKDFNGIMTLITEFKVTVMSLLMNS